MANNSTQNKWESYNLLGLRIDAISKKQFIDEVANFIDNFDKNDSKPEYIVTPNSEFFVNAQLDHEYQEAINNSYISIADGVFVQWVSTFINLPITAKYKPLRALQVVWQYVHTGASIVLKPSKVRKYINERLSGSQIVYDLAELAAQKGYRIALAGGYLINEKGAKPVPKEISDKYGDAPKVTTGKVAMDVLKSKYLTLKFVTDIPIDETRELPADTIQKLKESHADILIFGYKTGVQEKWLQENMPKTGIKLGFGLGGTLDYVSGIKKTPPKWMRILGIEWLLRPLLAEGISGRTLPRIKRAWQKGFFMSSGLALREKFKKI